MVNERFTYATAQLSIKGNQFDPTDVILGVLSDGTLGSGISASDGEIAFNESLSGVWPANGMFRVKTGSNRIEYIRYGAFISSSGVGSLDRGAAGSTAGAHSLNDVAQLGGWEVPLGVQTVSIGTTFNLEDAFTIGQLDAYQVVEGLPEAEMTVENVLDGTKPLWLMVTDPDFSELKGRTAEYQADLAVTVFPDTGSSAIGTADSNVVVSGAFISSWSLDMPADGNFVESITMVANNKSWGLEEGTPSGYFPASDSYDAEVIGSGIQRTEDFDRTASTLPADIPAADKISNINISADITREDLFELGQKTPSFRSVTFPVTVTTTFETVTSEGDNVNAIGDGRTNLVNRTMSIVTKSGLVINLGTKNKLSSVNFEGFDAGGGNATVTFEYTNSNSLTITHAGFPNAFSNNQDLPNAPTF